MLGNYFNGVGARIRKGEMGEVLREMELFSNRLNPFPSADSYLGEWAMFLNKVFGRTFDLSGAAVPGDKRSFERMLVRPQGPTMNEMLQACRRGWQGRPGFPVRSAYGDDL
ncbi:hypothetical protein KJ616_02865, partial [Patescibacteria group bacterium]|nr:hypothetical protein [Patescibacteria group bacterium]